MRFWAFLGLVSVVVHRKGERPQKGRERAFTGPVWCPVSYVRVACGVRARNIQKTFLINNSIIYIIYTIFVEANTNLLNYTIMKKYTIYNGIDQLTRKQVNQQRAAEKRAVNQELQDFANSLEYAYKQLTARDAATRNTANAVKGQYKTAAAVVANCYPYQAAAPFTYTVIIKDGTQERRADAGALLTRVIVGKDNDGAPVVKYKVKRLTGRAAAGSVIAAALKRFIDYKTGRAAALVETIPPADIIG